MLEIKRVRQDEEDKIHYFYHCLIEKINTKGKEPKVFLGDQALSKEIRKGNIYVGISLNRIISIMILEHADSRSFHVKNFEMSSQNVSTLYAMGVDPDYSGHGVANQMISFAIEQSRINGSDILRLDVLKDNAKDLDVYQNLGFQPIGLAKIIKDEQILDCDIFECKL